MFHHSTFMISLTFSLYLLLSLFPTTTTALPTIGITYYSTTTTTRQDSPSPPPPSPDRITTAMQKLKLTHLRLEEPDPSIIRSLLYTNISLFLTIPNYLVTPIASNRSLARAWIYTHVLPFYPRAKITTISVGNAFTDVYPEFINNLLPAISNVHISLRDLGIRKISVSTSLSFVVAAKTSPFPPSSVSFQEPTGVNLIGPLLQFLSDTNSSFLINLYNLYRLRPEIPFGTALFQEHSFNFRDNFTTGVRYRNLFDITVDAVVSAMALAGYETIPVIVTETGWPSTGNELDANSAYAEIYLKGLVKHLKSGAGTPLLKDGVKAVSLYELFDKEGAAGNGRNWRILYPNGSTKYKIEFSSGSRRLVNVGLILLVIVVQVVNTINEVIAGTEPAENEVIPDTEPAENEVIADTKPAENEVVVDIEPSEKEIECILNTEDPSTPPYNDPLPAYHLKLAQVNKEAANVDEIRCKCKDTPPCTLAAVCACVRATKPCSAFCNCKKCANQRGSRELALLKRANTASAKAAEQSDKRHKTAV